MGDLSSQSADHGVTINPAAAHKIEVVRGPATLLYGANAIGGLVNVINEQIPTAQLNGYEGGFVTDFGTGAREGGVAGDVLWGNNRGRCMPAAPRAAPATCARPTATSTTRRGAARRRTSGCRGRATKHYVGGSYGYDDMRVWRAGRRRRRRSS